MGTTLLWTSVCLSVCPENCALLRPSPPCAFLRPNLVCFSVLQVEWDTGTPGQWANGTSGHWVIGTPGQCLSVLFVPLCLCISLPPQDTGTLGHQVTSTLGHQDKGWGWGAHLPQPCCAFFSTIYWNEKIGWPVIVSSIGTPWWCSVHMYALSISLLNNDNSHTLYC